MKPNIIFFLVDDMGWMDTTVNGSCYYETPHMERLAAQSMVFSNAYAANPLCSPTRASILTGRYPARLRITKAITQYEPESDDTPAPVIPPVAPAWKRVCDAPNRNFLPLGETTVAESMRAAGYHTCYMGKWHLGCGIHYPEYQGFDTVVGGTEGGGPPGGYFDPYRGTRLASRHPGEYVTDRLTDEALNYIAAHKDRPFFLFLAHYAVHGPWGHKESITSRFRAKVDPRGQQNNPVMASMLYSVDDSLGRLLNCLDELGISGNTVIIFTSDNGGNIHSEVEGKPPTNNSPLRGGKATIYEGGTRVPLMVRWPGVVEHASVSDTVVSSIDFYSTILDMAGAAQGNPESIDGVSLAPVLQGGDLYREAIFCHFPHYVGELNTPSTYVRQGDWKLIRFYGEGPERSTKTELYNLKDDIGEADNLALTMPERVQQLDRLMDDFVHDTGALMPVPNPRYDPAAPREPGRQRRR